MCHLLTAIPVPELGIVAFKPGINQLHHFSGRMIVMSAPDELSDAKAGRIAEQAVLNLVIDANPPASLMKIQKLKRWGNQNICSGLSRVRVVSARSQRMMPIILSVMATGYRRKST